jgi:hypothetical protein
MPNGASSRYGVWVIAHHYPEARDCFGLEMMLGNKQTRGYEAEDSMDDEQEKIIDGGVGREEPPQHGVGR